MVRNKVCVEMREFLPDRSQRCRWRQTAHHWDSVKVVWKGRQRTGVCCGVAAQTGKAMPSSIPGTPMPTFLMNLSPAYRCAAY